MARRGDDERGPWMTEAVDLVRAASAGMLFGIPLLYTMEVWWTGERTGPVRMMVVLLLAAAPVFLLNRTHGFRDAPRPATLDVLKDTVETIAVGLLCVTGMLLLLRQIDGGTPLQAALGKIVYEAVPFAIGIGIAQHFLREGRLGNGNGNGNGNGKGNGRDSERRSRPETRSGTSATLADMGATVVGATFVALNIAPTDEVPMLAAAIGPRGLVSVVLVSLVVSYAIVFEGGFAHEEQRRAQPGIFQHPVTETGASYVIALASAVAMLWLFQRAQGPWTVTLSETIVLGLPAAVGGAAGRLAV